MTTDSLLKTAVVVLVALLAWWLLTRIGPRVVDRIAKPDDPADLERRQQAETVWTVIRRVAVIVILVTSALTIALIWAIPVAPFVAVGSVVGVAVGFGAQNVVKDVIAGFLIVSERQFSIGDVVKIADVSGAVEDVRLRVTVLRDLDGIVHYIPNGTITVASNFTQEFSKIVVDVGVGYDADVDHALAVLADELARFWADDDWVTKMPAAPEVLGVDRLADSAVILRGVLTTIPAERWVVKREALRRVKLRFDGEGITIPFPQLSVHLRSSRPD